MFNCSVKSLLLNLLFQLGSINQVVMSRKGGAAKMLLNFLYALKLSANGFYCMTFWIKESCFVPMVFIVFLSFSNVHKPPHYIILLTSAHNKHTLIYNSLVYNSSIHFTCINQFTCMHAFTVCTYSSQ